MITSAETKELFEALRTARQKFPELRKTAEAHYGKFVDYNSLRESIDPVLEEFDLLVFQIPDESGGEPALTTRLYHYPSEQWVEATTVLSLSKKDPQAQGSAITYMKRYGLTTILGLKNVDVDDDGDVASLPDSQVKRGNTNKAVADKRRDLESAAQSQGWTKARLTKWYHDHYKVDYKQDTDESHLAEALASVVLKDEQ